MAKIDLKIDFRAFLGCFGGIPDAGSGYPLYSSPPAHLPCRCGVPLLSLPKVTQIFEASAKSKSQ